MPSQMTFELKSGQVRGYRKKPRWIAAIAASYLAIPTLCFWQLARSVDYDTTLMPQLAVDPFFLFEAFGGISCAIAVFIVSRASFVYFVGFGLYILSAKFLELSEAPLFESPQSLALTGSWFALTALFLSNTLRTPYLNPKARWWEQPERLQFVSRGVLIHGEHRFPIVTLNLSSGGVFAKLDERAMPDFGAAPDLKLSGSPDRRKTEPTGAMLLSPEQVIAARESLAAYPVALGTDVRVRLQVHPDAARHFDCAAFEYAAEVVWSAPSSGPYRFGVGLRFRDRSRQETKTFREYLRWLEEVGVPSRDES